MFIYFDESKYPQKNFINGSFVFCHEDPNEFIFDTLKIHGFDPEIDEYKSSTHFGRNPNMVGVRDKLKSYFHQNCKFGIVFLQYDELSNLGFFALEALKQFLDENNFGNNHQIYFDEGIFKSQTNAIKYIKDIGLDQNTFHLERDSRRVRGIQLADLCAHCLTTMLRETLGDLSKMVKVGEGNGYDPDTEFEIGFDIWASIRYGFLKENDKKFIESESIEDNFTFYVEPYGLFISKNCEKKLAKKVRETFGKVYLGCIH